MFSFGWCSSYYFLIWAGASPPPQFGKCPKENIFFKRRSSLTVPFYSCQWTGYQHCYGFRENKAIGTTYEGRRSDYAPFQANHHQPVEWPGYADFWHKLVRPDAVMQPLSSTLCHPLHTEPTLCKILSKFAQKVNADSLISLHRRRADCSSYLQLGEVHSVYNLYGKNTRNIY